jgi:hypothetical protein
MADGQTAEGHRTEKPKIGNGGAGDLQLPAAPPNAQAQPQDQDEAAEKARVEGDAIRSRVLAESGLQSDEEEDP